MTKVLQGIKYNCGRKLLLFTLLLIIQNKKNLMSGDLKSQSSVDKNERSYIDCMRMKILSKFLIKDMFNSIICLLFSILLMTLLTILNLLYFVSF